MKKVYLSKSKSGSFDDIVKVRQYCKELGFDLKEFMGGNYNTKELDSCNYLIVLPPYLEYPMTIGKGQYTEIMRFLKTGDRQNLFIVSDISNRLIVDELIKTKVIDIDWQTEYAELETSQCQIDIINFEIVNPKNIKDEYFDDYKFELQVGERTEIIKPMLACINL